MDCLSIGLFQPQRSARNNRNQLCSCLSRFPHLQNGKQGPFLKAVRGEMFLWWEQKELTGLHLFIYLIKFIRSNLFVYLNLFVYFGPGSCPVVQTDLELTI